MFFRIYLANRLVPLQNRFYNTPGETFDVTPFVDGRCKTPTPEIQAAVDGAISEEQAVKLRQCLAHIDELETHKSEIEREIFRLSSKYESVLDLIRTVPGFDKNPLTAIQVLSEIGADISVFPTAKNLVSWTGCCPRNDQSNHKIKSTRISRAGSYFKPVLVQVANALIKWFICYALCFLAVFYLLV